MSNKTLVSQSQAILKDLGYEVKTSHLHELFARLAGYRDNNTAAAAGAKFGLVVEDPKRNADLVRLVGMSMQDRIEATLGEVQHVEVDFEQIHYHGRLTNAERYQEGWAEFGLTTPYARVEFEGLKEQGHTNGTYDVRVPYVDYLKHTFQGTKVFGQPVGDRWIASFLAGVRKAREAGAFMPELLDQLLLAHEGSNWEAIAKYWSESDTPDAAWLQDYNYELACDAARALVKLES